MTPSLPRLRPFRISRLRPSRISRRIPRLAAAAVVVVLLVATGCTQSVGEYGPVVRGDRAFARGDVEEALAEYRLALLEGNEDPEVHARVGHTYARLGRVEEAADSYGQAAAGDSAWADQAAADLVHLAREAAERNDLYGVASAIQRALRFRPGLTVSDLSLPLARHYARNGEYGRALPFFQRALASVPQDSAPAIMYETGMAYEEIGDCGRAVVFFEQYRQLVSRSRGTDVNWYLGNCSFRHGTSLLEEGRLESALRYIDTTIEIGEPRSVQAQAYFERGRILSIMGACRDALEAYRQVPAADVAGVGSLVSRAQRRIDEIRFGGHLDSFEPDSRCGLRESEVPALPDDASPADSVGADSLRTDSIPAAPVPADSFPGPDGSDDIGGE